MSALGRLPGLGPIMQIAYVPGDFDAALDYWTRTMGVGPFYVLEHVALDDVKYRGTPQTIDFSIAIAYWGEVQIELVKQHNDAPSIYRTWREAGREGVHHYCVMTDDLAATRAHCATAGFEIMQEGMLPGGGGALYVDAGPVLGGLLEILEAPQTSLDAFAFIKAQAKAWDGSDPVRKLG